MQAIRPYDSATAAANLSAPRHLPREAVAALLAQLYKEATSGSAAAKLWKRLGKEAFSHEMDALKARVCVGGRGQWNAAIARGDN